MKFLMYQYLLYIEKSQGQFDKIVEVLTWCSLAHFCSVFSHDPAVTLKGHQTDVLAISILKEGQLIQRQTAPEIRQISFPLLYLKNMF